jgi:molybdopterin-binding protein
MVLYDSIRMSADLLNVQGAAKLLGVSYPTLKQWIYKKKIRSVKTPGGHHRIPRGEVDRLSALRTVTKRGVKPVGIDAISGRNKLGGIVTSIRYEGLLAQVTIDIGGQQVTAIITKTACKDLGLMKGVRAYALMKATEVMVVRS